jgi:hypothetical protein
MARTATAPKKPAAKKAEGDAPPPPKLQVVAAARPACATCPFWQARATLGNLCKRFPSPVIKGAEDWCGEHPAFHAQNLNTHNTENQHDAHA